MIIFKRINLYKEGNFNFFEVIGDLDERVF